MAAENVVFGGGGSDFPAIMMWENPAKENSPIIVSRFPSRGSVYSLAISPEGTRLVAGTRTGQLRVHILNNYIGAENAPVAVEVFHHPSVTSVAFCTEDIFASGGLDGKIRIWSATDGKMLAEISAHPGGVFALCPLGSLVLASIGKDEQLKIWDLDTLERKYVSDPFTLPKIHALTSLAYHHSSGLLMHPSRSGELHLYEVRNNFTTRRIKIHRGDFCALSCSLEHIVTGGYEDSMLKVWSPSLDKLLEASLPSGIIAAAWSGDKFIMVVYSDSSEQLWKIGNTLKPDNRRSNIKLRSCIGLPSETVAIISSSKIRKWQNEKLTNARILLKKPSFGPEERTELADIIEALLSRGFLAEATFLLAEGFKVQGLFLQELESRLALANGLKDEKASIPYFYVLADLLEKLKEPKLAIKYFNKILKIERNHLDVKNRISKLKSQPLTKLCLKTGVRFDLKQNDQIIQEFEKHTILRKKFKWPIILKAKPPLKFNVKMDAQAVNEALLAATQNHGIDISKSKIDEATILDGLGLRKIQWVYLPSLSIRLGVVYALEVRSTSLYSDVVSYELFDARLLEISESISVGKHNQAVKETWTELIHSSEATRWLEDIDKLAIRAARGLKNKLLAQEESEF